MHPSSQQNGTQRRVSGSRGGWLYRAAHCTETVAMTDKKMKAAVLGTGTMGPSIALTFALHGHETALIGRSEAALAAAYMAVKTAHDELAGANLLPPTEAGWQERLTVTADQRAGVTHADVVVEAIAEDLTVKQELFATLDQATSIDALLTSSTSGLPVDDIAARCARPERVAVLHFANPPHLMPAVEVVPGTATTSTVMDALCALVVDLGKEPVRLTRDIPGHLFNRLQFALMREAFALVRDGVASADEVDRVVKRGYALRLAAEGPLEKADLAGLELVASVGRYLFPTLDVSTEPDQVDSLIAEGRTGAKAGEGFHAWTPERARDVIAARNQEVIRHLKRLRRDDR
jgi:3-hydroxybutyryl-CoA dehydrogenase